MMTLLLKISMTKKIKKILNNKFTDNKFDEEKVIKAYNNEALTQNLK